MFNSLLTDLLKYIYLKYENNKLYYENKFITDKMEYILEFLGLCFKLYRRGFKNDFEIFEYFKGSHFFNVEFTKNEKFLKYYILNPKQIQFDRTNSTYTKRHVEFIKRFFANYNVSILF